MKKTVVVLLALSLMINAALGIMLKSTQNDLREMEHEIANQTLFAMESLSGMNDILQKMVNDKSIERHELSAMQHSIIYITATFDRAQHMFVKEMNNENYHISFLYLTALEDIIYKIESIEPLDEDILAALTGSASVAGGRYEYGLAEYIQLLTTKSNDAIARLNIQEQPAADGDGVVTIYPEISEIKKIFVEIFK